MDATNVTTIVLMAVLGLIGLASLAGGLWALLKARRLRRLCTATAQGTLYDLVYEGLRRRKRAQREETVVAANEAIAQKKRSYLAKKHAQAEAEAQAAEQVWRPQVRFAVGETTFERPAARCVTRDKRKLGSTVEVHYDPKNPSTCWFSIDGLPGGVGSILTGCGLVLLIIAAACWFVVPDTMAFFGGE